MGEITMENNEEITCYEGLKFNQKWIVEDLRDGKRKPTDIDWWQVSNGSVEDLRFIAYALQEKAGYNQAVEMVECTVYQSKIDSKASEDYIKRVSALLEYWQKIESRYQQPTPSSRTDQPPAEPTTAEQVPPQFEQQLHNDIAWLMPFFDMLEDVGEIEIRGKGKRKLLDKSGGKWVFATKTLCGYVAYKMQTDLGITDPYKRMSEVTGVSNSSLIMAHSKNQCPNGGLEVDEVVNKYQSQQKQNKR